MSISKINPNIQSKNWSHGDENENFLFVDLSIVLKAKLQWKGDLIPKIIFSLYNIDSNYSYKICGVTNCAADGEYMYPYILIHLARDGNSFKSVYTATSLQLGQLSLPKDAKAHFLFRIHDSCPQTFSCGFGKIKPLSKDGSIIIAI